MAAAWYLDGVKSSISKLAAKYIMFEGVEGNTFLEQSMQAPRGFEGDRYAELLVGAAAKLGNSAIVTASTR